MSWDIVRRFKVAGGLTITRVASVAFTNGVGTATTSTFTLDPVAVYYREGARDMTGGPPRVVEATLVLMSETRLNPSGVSVTGDRFTYDGYNWEVQASRKWEFANLFYAEAMKVP